jgi:hypothetical protein
MDKTSATQLVVRKGIVGLFRRGYTLGAKITFFLIFVHVIFIPVHQKHPLFPNVAVG